ncbi:MAG: hypothetical protein NTY81_01680 [Candidatus Staskawiczbacteria bacterium]|nr:hypothetical protein [Candidatus Staskawiczbacteria bacterium]
MAEQQLVDYIKKAKDAGQTEGQMRDLLYKNGWTETEVSDALTAASPVVSPPQIKVQPEPQSQPQPQPQPQPQEQLPAQPKIVEQPQVSQLQPQASYKPEPMETNMPRMRKSHFVLKFLIVFIIVVVLCGAGYFSAGQYLNLPYSNFILNFFRPSPQTVINNMMTNMKDVKSSHTAMQIEISAANNGASQGKLTLNADSETDMTDAKNIKADGSFKINLAIPGSVSPLVADVNIAIVGSAFYIRVNEITIPASYTSPGLDVSKIKGKWFKVDQDSIKALSQAEGSAQTATPNISQAGASDLAKKIQDLIVSENMISVVKQLNDQTVSGQGAYHYSAVVKKEKLQDLITKIIVLAIGENAGNSNLTAYKNIIDGNVKTMTDSLGDINMEIWIGKKDYMLYQVKLDKTIDLGKNNMQLEVKLNITNSNFNKPISVQVPPNAQKLEEFALPLMKLQNINNDINQIGFDAEMLYSSNKSYSLVCKNGFLNGSKTTSYGLEFISIANDIIKQGGKNPVCFSGIQNYCSSTQLADGTYLCIDKNEKVGTTKCVSAQTACK